MGLFEKIAVIDLKVNLSLIPAGLIFAAATVAGMVLISPTRGLYIGALVGAILGGAAFYLTYQRLPS